MTRRPERPEGGAPLGGEPGKSMSAPLGGEAHGNGPLGGDGHGNAPSHNEPLDDEELAAVIGTATLFGELWALELDAEGLARLRDPGLSEALLALGVDVPGAPPGTPSGDFALAELAREHRALGAGPTSLHASAWSGGVDVTATLGDLLALAGVEFDGRGARHGAVDHLGSLLLLWAACAEAAPPVADVLALDHLAWADEPLARLGRGAGFYASLARATRELVAAIAATRLTG